LRYPDIRIQQYRNKEYWVNIAKNQINLLKCMCHWTREHGREQVRPVPLERFGANPTGLDTSGAKLAPRAPFFIDLMDHRLACWETS
jgi:hypothetical protein